VPSPKSPQVQPLPADTCVNVPAGGVAAPAEFAPQQATEPSARIAQVCCPPALSFGELRRHAPTLPGLLQWPVAWSHVPASWHWSLAAQVTDEPVQVPAWQLSACVQALPSSQPVPFGLVGFEHCAVLGSQVPTSWHESEAVHLTGLLPVHVPP
jgi:hypothetical protein